jgi:hypothetical protein
MCYLLAAIFRICCLCDASFQIDSRAREKQNRNKVNIRSVGHGFAGTLRSEPVTSTACCDGYRQISTVDGHEQTDSRGWIQTDNRGLLQQNRRSMVRTGVCLLAFCCNATTHFIEIDPVSFIKRKKRHNASLGLHIILCTCTLVGS